MILDSLNEEEFSLPLLQSNKTEIEKLIAESF